MTKLTNDKCFIDTNILIYCYSSSELTKQAIARSLVDRGNIYISTQVCKEFANTAKRKLNLGWALISQILETFNNSATVHTNALETIQYACKIAERYQYSFYDSLIISAALSCNCNILFSEDMQHNQLIDNRLKIVNPFAEGA